MCAPRVSGLPGSAMMTSVDPDIKLFDYLLDLDKDPRLFRASPAPLLARLSHELKCAVRAALDLKSDWDGQAPRVWAGPPESSG